MQRTGILGCAIAAVAICTLTSVRAQVPSPLGGVWALNRARSMVPREIGFNLAPPPAGDGGQTSGSGGGRGRRGSSGGGGRSGGAIPVVRESYLDGQRLRLATTEARNPPSRLVIVDNPGAVTLTRALWPLTMTPGGVDSTLVTPELASRDNSGDSVR